MTRRGHRQKRIANAIRQLPWRNVVNPYAATEILNDELVEYVEKRRPLLLANAN